MKQENNKCLTKKEDQPTKPKEIEMSSNKFLLSKKFKENQNLKLKERGK